MHHLRRFPSAASFSSLLRTPTNDQPDSRARSHSFASSSLADALQSPIISPPVPKIDPLTLANQELISALESLQIVHRSAYSERLNLILQIQHILTDQVRLLRPGRAKPAHDLTAVVPLVAQPDARNTFREHGGFLNAVSVLAGLEEAAAAGGGEGSDSVQTRTAMRYELVKLVFTVLALAFEGHDVNRAAFGDTVGFEAVGEAIKLSGLMKEQVESVEEEDTFEEALEDVTGEEGPGPSSPAEKLLSILYAFLTADFSSPPLFAYLRHRLHAFDKTATTALPADDFTPLPKLDPPSRASEIATLLAQRAAAIENTGGEAAEYAEVVPLLLELQSQLPESEQELSLMVLAALQQLALSSRRSQIGLNEAGVVGIALARLFPNEEAEEETKARAESPEREIWIALTERLLEMGAGTQETRKLFKSAVEGWRQPGGKEVLNEEVLSLM